MYNCGSNDVLLDECSDTQREDSEDITHLDMEVPTQLEKGNIEGDDNNNFGRKRDREDDSSGSWTTVNGLGKRTARRQTPVQEISCNYEEGTVEICVYNNEKFPKQFALARLFKTNDIVGITRVKYINPYKLIITFDNESHAGKMMNCKVFKEMGWRSQKSWEVAVSYGIIRDIELDISIEEFVTNVSCDVEILSAIRLNRRFNDTDDKGVTSNGWIASESIRICFKGAHVPSYVNIYGMRARVERYILPVTQCSKCWRYGHIAKMCTSSKVKCPKCGGSHDNCDKTTFICVNCKGNHLALDKKCPVYLKEKRLRELMNEFNCTYRKALLLYVPASPPPTFLIETIDVRENKNLTNTLESNPVQLNEDQTTYADIVKTPVIIPGQQQAISSHSKRESKQKTAHHKKRLQCRPSATATTGVMDWDSEVSSTTCVSEELETSSHTDKPKKLSEHNRNKSSDHKPKDTLSGNFISNITNILLKKDSLKNKINNVVKIIVEWLIILVVNNLPENSLVSKLINGLS